ncbi:hypothetical protein BUALT_Bualt09G0080900 [Buddleja alternifolia]|uniref:Uncharacterized protein n=1 Tax=Buddleja alternifolia TaxID=168488 RepID=A0AAV6XBR4_9LAMI|nr:hypothetical protein BUALT_Bualt09G0080900 [Buddleja alternifolia]
MGRAPCCDKANVKKGPWSPEEDAKLKEYIEKHGTVGNWISLPHKAALRRCGKSCRLRWLNYLRPNIKHGEFSDDEDKIICSLFDRIGSRWSVIAAQLPGRTDNDIKNYWNTKLKKKLQVHVASTQYPKTRPHQSAMHPLPSDNSLVQNHPSIPYHDHLNSSFDNYTSTPIRAFYHHDHPIFSSSFVGPTTQGDYNQVKLMYGGEASSRSSSDGSCITTINQVEIDHGFFSNSEKLGFPMSSYNNFSNDHKAANGTCFSHEIYPDDQDYNSIEEIKQLIGTNNVCNNLNFFVDHDQIKSEDLS